MIQSTLQPAFQLEVSTVKAFAELLPRLGARHKNLVVLDGNSSKLFQTGAFALHFPERHFNFGNSQQSQIAAACGFTVRGKIPLVLNTAISLTGRAWEQIRNQVCQANLNVKIIGCDAGLLFGQDGGNFQALEDFAILRAIPNMKILCPADAVETKKMLEAMMNDYGPTYLRLSTHPLPVLYGQNHEFRFGKASIYKPGTDICIFATGVTVHTALTAAELLERDGISTMVVNMGSLKPIDEALIVECAKSVFSARIKAKIVTVEDHQIVGGLGTSVSEVLSTYYPVEVLRLGMDGFGESGRLEDLYKKYRLDGQGIYEAIINN